MSVPLNPAMCDKAPETGSLMTVVEIETAADG